MLDVEPLDSGECGIGSVAFGGPRKPHKADEGRTMRSRLCKAWPIPAGRHAKGTMTVSAGHDGLNLQGLGWCALGPGIVSTYTMQVIPLPFDLLERCRS